MSGARYERELVKLLYSKGYGTIRLPSSGAGTDRPLPDVMIGNSDLKDPRSDLMACELKSGRDTTLYVKRDEVKQLNKFCERCDARPYLVARFSTKGSSTDYYFVHPRDARTTKTGNYGLPLEDIEDRASWIVGDN